MLLVTIQFLTPKGALLGFLVLVPLAAFLAVSKRATGVREALGVPALPESARLVPLGAVVAVGVLLGLAPHSRSSSAPRTARFARTPRRTSSST